MFFIYIPNLTNQLINYSRNKWNHLVFEYDCKENTISLTLNSKKTKKESLKEDFKIFDYTNKRIKISDSDSKISLSTISVFDCVLNDEIKKELYFSEDSTLNDIQTRFGISPVIYLNYQKVYSRNLVLDSGAFLNHFTLNGDIKTKEEKIELSDTIYIPFRLEGKYKSLVHENDVDIIRNYYEYNPDVIENSDIFFHEVITNELDYTKLGLSNIKYKLIDKIKRDGYELIRIVT